MITQAKQALYNMIGLFGFEESLGDDLHQKKGVIVGKYSFAVQGGAVGSKNLLLDLSDTKSLVKLPINAIVTNVYLDIITAFTSTGGTGTIALSLQSAGDLLAAVDADTLSGRAQGIPDNTVANTIKLTAERTLTLPVATAALLTGKANVFVEYVISE